MRTRRLVETMAILAAGVPMATPPAPAPLPFGIGERLTYGVKANGVGGHATMSVTGPVDVRGTETELLAFDVEAGVGPIKGVNRTQSWLDPQRVAALRFEAYEHRPFSTHRERVDMYPDDARWEAADGRSGQSATDAPLDELSFIYFVRSLPLDADSALTFDRFFDETRNPTVVRVLSHDTTTTDAGTFRTIRVEMQVRDPRHYAGEGTLLLWLSDDACRIPVRMESRMPNVGVVLFTLRTYVHPSDDCTSRMP